jgi:hypothetical protein
MTFSEFFVSFKSYQSNPKSFLISDSNLVFASSNDFSEAWSSVNFLNDKIHSLLAIISTFGVKSVNVLWPFVEVLPKNPFFGPLVICLKPIRYSCIDSTISKNTALFTSSIFCFLSNSIRLFACQKFKTPPINVPARAPKPKGATLVSQKSISIGISSYLRQTLALLDFNTGPRYPGLHAASSPRSAGRLSASANCFTIPQGACASKSNLSVRLSLPGVTPDPLFNRHPFGCLFQHTVRHQGGPEAWARETGEAMKNTKEVTGPKAKKHGPGTKKYRPVKSGKTT